MGLYAAALTNEQKFQARAIGRSAWIDSGNDVRYARRLAKDRLYEEREAAKPKGVGSIVIFITVTAAMLQIIYYAIKIWNLRGVSIPSLEPQPWEPFEL